MGKKHRRHAVQPAQHPLCLAAPPPMSPKEARRELRAALAALALETAGQARIDRLNNLPFSHPENVHKIGATFDPIEAWMDGVVATGDIDVTDKGLAILRTDPADEAWYPLVASFLAVCDTYELIAAGLAVIDLGAGLRQLADKVRVDMPLFQRDIDAARASLDWMKAVTAPLTPRQFSDFTVAIQVRATLAEIERGKRAA